MNVSSELNQTCEEARFYGREILSEDVESFMRKFSIGFFVTLFPFSICLTTFTIFLILKFKHLRQTTFLLALQLVIVDLVLALTFTPLSILGAVNGRWVLGLSFCRVVYTEIVFVYQFRGWLMFVFVCDRFFTVFIPFHYHKYRNKIILSLIAGVLFMIVVALIIPLALDCSGFDRETWICLGFANEGCPNKSTCQIYATIAILMGNIGGSVVPMLMYIALFIKAKRIRKQLSTSVDSTIDLEQRKRDRKANVTFLTLFLSLFGVSFPPLFVYIFNNNILVPLGVQPPEVLLVITYILQMLYLILPITDSIAIMRNPEVRKALQIIKKKWFPIKLERKEPECGSEVTTSTATTTSNIKESEEL